MPVLKSFLAKGLALAVIAAGVASCADETDRPVPTRVAVNSYVVCNAYNECWRAHEHYTTYPADQRIVYHDDAWWTAHHNDTAWRFESDPADDHGYYDKDGVWHPFGP